MVPVNSGIGYNDKSLRVLLVRHRGRSRVSHVAALGLNLSTGFFFGGGPIVFSQFIPDRLGLLSDEDPSMYHTKILFS